MKQHWARWVLAIACALVILAAWAFLPEPATAAENSVNTEALTARGTLWILVGVFFGGLALNLTPCVYPLIPVTISYFGSRRGTGTIALAIHGLLYVGGLSVINSLLGVTAALSGGLMGAALQSPLVHFFVAAVLVFFSTSLFGLWELRLPTSLARAASRSYGGYFGSLFMGSTLGLVAAPCLGPFVLGLLTWVASTGSVWLGFPVFFSLSLGLGTPLFFLAVFSGCLDKLPASGEWLLWIRKVMGWVLVGMAVHFICPAVPEIVGHVLLAGVFLVGGLHLGWIDGTQAGSRLFRGLRTAVGMAGVALALIIMWPTLGSGAGVSWQPYSDDAIAAARYANKPMILSFSAKWCVPCRQLEETTFTDPELVRRARRDFVMIKADLTSCQDSLRDTLLLKYNIKGVPTIVFFDRSGRERSELRIIGYAPPDQVLQRMNQLKQ